MHANERDDAPTGRLNEDVETDSAWPATVPHLLTRQQEALDRMALSLAHEPAVEAARDRMAAQWRGLQPASTHDGAEQLAPAVDEVVFVGLRSAAADPSHPEVIWTEAPPYSIGNLHVPGSRGGDNPDRIYRFAAVDPRYRYVIHGQRDEMPSLEEFSFEALTAPAIYGGPQCVLSSEAVDIASDGSFTITADAAPANGRRSHLHLPPGTSTVLIRDTLADWSSQLPNALHIERIEGTPDAPRSRDDLLEEAVNSVKAIAEANVKFVDWTWQEPANQLTPIRRPIAWGMPSSGLAMNRFSLGVDEVLVVTLDLLEAEYLGFVIGDPWLRSVDYWNRSGSLNNQQSQPNADGSYTFVVSPRDPGVHNWLDTCNLTDGVMTVRWEGLEAEAPVEAAIRESRTVRWDNFHAAVPEATLITPTERRRLLNERRKAYTQRLR